ncbi:hypothetical protein ACFL4L_07265, partial [bacterium]
MENQMKRRHFIKQSLTAGSSMALLSHMPSLKANQSEEVVDSNKTLQTIFDLRTIHGNFTEQSVPDEQIEQIVKASVQAANSS